MQYLKKVIYSKQIAFRIFNAFFFLFSSLKFATVTKAMRSVLIMVTSCNTKIDKFLMSHHHIGELTDSTQVKDLEAVFIDDSIVKNIAGDEFLGRTNDIEVFEKGGKQLLVLTPTEALDSTSTIRTIKIIDDRFRTLKGLTINSTFGDIKTNYKISSIQNTLKNVVIFTSDSNFFFTIDKNELPSELRFDMSKKIEAVQIPDQSKIKYFMIGW